MASKFFLEVRVANKISHIRKIRDKIRLSIQRINAIEIMNANGEKLKKDLISAGEEFGLKMKVTGVPSMPYFRIEDQNFAGFQHF